MTATIDHNEAFRARFAGQILTRGDSGYDSARELWNGSLDRHERLARIKAAYDPDNVFHLNANITPAAADMTATAPD